MPPVWPSAAGGAYIPAFCDVVIVRRNASMYLGSPRMAEMVIGEKVTLEEMGGARMHSGVSGCGDVLVKTDEEAIDVARRYLRYFPVELATRSRRRAARRARRERQSTRSSRPTRTSRSTCSRSRRLVDADSFFEIHTRWAEIRRLRAGSTAGWSGSSPTSRKQKGGVLFVDSADKAARFIRTCNAFNVPLLFLADVPGFMIGTRSSARGSSATGPR